MIPIHQTAFFDHVIAFQCRKRDDLNLGLSL
ncbi:Uncharacterised protein [Vibrio cholerae]|nr:Uncharacterised protein [Vibrio cholerae]